LKNIKNNSFEIFKNSIRTPNNSKIKNSKIQKLTEGGLKSKKVQKTNFSQNCKILRMAFSNILKTQQLPQKHPKTKNSKNLKTHRRRPQIKNSENK